MNDQGRQLAHVKSLQDFFKSDTVRRLISRQTLTVVDAWVRRYGAWLLLAFAFCYYSQYYRSGLNLGGEGGTAGVIALRLMEGQRPIVDTFLGYNVMWFYPIVWLFQWTGPDYIALRIYFFVICTFSALLGFGVLARFTRSGLFALAVSVLLVLMPGMIFRNYLPFLAVLNMYLLLHAYVFSGISTGWRLVWMTLAGAALGLTFLIRVELGIFFSIINLGLVVLFPFAVRGQIVDRLKLAFGGLVLAIIMVFATHVPVYLDAKNRGFDKSFLEQYVSWIGLLRSKFDMEVVASPKAVATPQATQTESPTPAQITDSPVANSATSGSDDGELQRQPLGNLWKLPSIYDRTFVAITYLPVLLSILILGVFGTVFLLALRKGDARFHENTLAVLTCLGCSLTLFPQYYFFRPDTPHLSEFMVPFLVTLGCVIWQMVRWTISVRVVVLKVSCLVVVVLSLTNASLYVYHSMPKESAGTIAAARKRTYEFQAENGVRVLLKRREKEDYQKIYDIIQKHSKPDEYVVCYPYSPTINFMTNRRSYEHNLYVDNATASPRVRENILLGIQGKHPAIIIIDNRDINQFDSSRFAVWASRAYDYIKVNYNHLGTFRRQEIYARQKASRHSVEIDD